MTVAIYVLFDPREPCAARYIGKTAKPKERLASHRLPPRNSLSPVAHWTRKLRREGVLVEMRVLAWTLNWEAAEVRTIERFKRAGHRLLNIEAGGRGSYARGAKKPATGDRTFRDAMKLCGKVAVRFEKRGQHTEAQVLRDCMVIIKRKREEIGRQGAEAITEFDRNFTMDALYQRTPEMIARLNNASS